MNSVSPGYGRLLLAGWRARRDLQRATGAVPSAPNQKREWNHDPLLTAISFDSLTVYDSWVRKPRQPRETSHTGPRIIGGILNIKFQTNLILSSVLAVKTTVLSIKKRETPLKPGRESFAPFKLDYPFLRRKQSLIDQYVDPTCSGFITHGYILLPGESGNESQ